jgi:hypothetical protein
MTKGDMPKTAANRDAPLTNASAPIIRKPSPTMNKKIAMVALRSFNCRPTYCSEVVRYEPSLAAEGYTVPAGKSCFVIPELSDF